MGSDEDEDDEFVRERETGDQGGLVSVTLWDPSLSLMEALRNNEAGRWLFRGVMIHDFSWMSEGDWELLEAWAERRLDVLASERGLTEEDLVSQWLELDEEFDEHAGIAARTLEERVVLMHVNGFDAPDIARRLGIPEDEVRRRMTDEALASFIDWTPPTWTQRSRLLATYPDIAPVSDAVFAASAWSPRRCVHFDLALEPRRRWRALGASLRALQSGSESARLRVARRRASLRPGYP
jgi:hypothetical protein